MAKSSVKDWTMHPKFTAPYKTYGRTYRVPKKAPDLTDKEKNDLKCTGIEKLKYYKAQDTKLPTINEMGDKQTRIENEQKKRTSSSSQSIIEQGNLPKKRCTVERKRDCMDSGIYDFTASPKCNKQLIVSRKWSEKHKVVHLLLNIIFDFVYFSF